MTYFYVNVKKSYFLLLQKVDCQHKQYFHNSSYSEFLSSDKY